MAEFVQLGEALFRMGVIAKANGANIIRSQQIQRADQSYSLEKCGSMKLLKDGICLLSRMCLQAIHPSGMQIFGIFFASICLIIMRLITVFQQRVP